MREMRGRVAHADGARHADFGKDFRLPLHRIGRGRPVVKPQIDQRRGHIFHRLEAHVVICRPQHPLQQVTWHRSPRISMGREFVQDGRHTEPMFIKLAGQFHEIARDGGAADAFIGHIRQHLVQSVAEFVKQSPRVVIGQKRGFARLGFGEVAHVDHMRAGIAAQPFL